MTVVGVGIDLVSVPEFAEQFEHAGTVFADHFTVGERRDAASGTSDDARHLAVRWAAKEAVVKAWSVSRFAQAPVMAAITHREIEVVTDAWGRPAIRIGGALREHLADITIHISLTHDGPMAAAVAVIEQRPVDET